MTTNGSDARIPARDKDSSGGTMLKPWCGSRHCAIRLRCRETVQSLGFMDRSSRSRCVLAISVVLGGAGCSLGDFSYLSDDYGTVGSGGSAGDMPAAGSSATAGA